MRAVIFEGVGLPLVLKEVPNPLPEAGQVLIQVSACGVCRTDLHIIDGELDQAKLPLILGHQIVGRVEKLGKEVEKFRIGDRVGVPWLGGSCGSCTYCTSGQENLCDKALYTGYQTDGGFAEYTVANAQFTFPIPQSYPDTLAAPLLCAGLIGYRALSMIKSAKEIGFYGFGASAHILTQLVTSKGGNVYAFTRKGDKKTQAFAKELGAIWAGNSDEKPPKNLDAAIIFAPDGALVPIALKSVCKGGSVICAGIHMSDIPSFGYDLLWEERSIHSVANLTRKDAEAFLTIAPQIPIKTNVTTYPLEKVGQALEDLRKGAFEGAAVILVT